MNASHGLVLNAGALVNLSATWVIFRYIESLSMAQELSIWVVTILTGLSVFFLMGWFGFLSELRETNWEFMEPILWIVSLAYLLGGAATVIFNSVGMISKAIPIFYLAALLAALAINWWLLITDNSRAEVH